MFGTALDISDAAKINDELPRAMEVSLDEFTSLHYHLGCSEKFSVFPTLYGVPLRVVDAKNSLVIFTGLFPLSRCEPVIEGQVEKNA